MRNELSKISTPIPTLISGSNRYSPVISIATPAAITPRGRRRVADHVQERRAHVQAVAAAVEEQQDRDDVAGEAGRGDPPSIGPASTSGGSPKRPPASQKT